MTDEELARQKAEEIEKNQTLGVYDNDEDLARDSAFNDGIVEGYEEGFLAGLKAGRPQWHDLRKDPKDLPKKYSISYPLSRTVVNQIGTPCHYNYASECWQNWSYIEIETPIAWCEIPTFDKE